MKGRSALGAIEILLLFLPFILFFEVIPTGHAMAADCALAPTGENYVGVRYKALLAEDDLSQTGWVLLFGGNGFTMNGEYEPHFMDLMIKAGWAAIYDDPLCANGFPQPKETRKNFTIQFGLSDYEDSTVQDNDIAAWSRDPKLFPRMFTNIDSTDPKAADKIMTEYQVDVGGTLEGKEIQVSFEREEVTRLSQDKNYFVDPDAGCKPNSQADILYRHWVATLEVPALGVNSSVDFYVNANQGDKLIGTNTLNFMWENYRRPVVESDRFKVILFDMETESVSGEWKEATKFLADLRTPNDELPLNSKGQLVGGYRRVTYKGEPAIEASFGYGYTDYVIDGNPNNYESSDATKALIDLQPTTHDVAVTGVQVCRNVISNTTPPLMNMTVANQGEFPETFNTALYINSTSLGTQNVSLTKGISTNINFTLNLTNFDYGNYTISAYAWPVAGEIDTTDNNMTSWITVTIPGDIDGNFQVQLNDLVLLARAYGSKLGDSNWNPNTDIDGNNSVGLSDLVMLAQHYGQHYP